MAETASDYHHGDQNPSAQVATYHLFNALTKYGALHIGVLILFFTLWFCTGAGFGGALITAVVLLVAGIVFLRRKPAADH
ncbi:MAG TPA: aa3-type cytochrome c oxidase subunit IV [Caulobacteraceae bacterium]|nr:aa3-type cytochrome c oxidase subunit IV [Caulobacteraceae bacterium]